MVTSVCCAPSLLEYGMCRQVSHVHCNKATRKTVEAVRRINVLQSHRTSTCSRSRLPRIVTRAGELIFPDEIGGVKEVFSREEFDERVKEAGDKLVVLDISTTTCGPCKMIYPKLVKLSEDYPEAVFLKINGDHSEGTRALMKEWGVRAVPNFRFFRNGEKVHSHTGAKEEDLRNNFLKHYEDVPAKAEL